MLDDQMTRLLRHSVDIREEKLRKSYGHVWEKLRANERIAVLSAFYNGESLVNTKTKFYAHLKKYVENNDPNSLKDAKAELESCRKNPELIERRKLEAKALDATMMPFYLKPNDKVISDQPLKIRYNETRVPLGLEQSFPQVQNSAFVIWRTKLDSKVRPEHLEREGKVYHINEIAELRNYGCRCVCEPVTTNLLIVDDRDKIISLHSWIRYGSASSFEGA